MSIGDKIMAVLTNLIAHDKRLEGIQNELNRAKEEHRQEVDVLRRLVEEIQEVRNDERHSW